MSLLWVGRLAMTCAVLGMLSGCATVSHEQLFPGIETVRTRFLLAVEFSDRVEARCREIQAELGLPAPPARLRYGACAVVPPDQGLKPGQLPWCRVVLPDQHWHAAMGHEILHCMGFAHDWPG